MKAWQALILSALIILMMVPVQQLSADDLIMRDGSRLIGEVIKRNQGILEFKTTYAGVIKVKWEQIAEIRTDKAMEFMLTDDSTVTVTRVTNNVEDMVVEGEAGMPAQALDQDMVAAINPEPWQKGEGFKFSGRVNFAFERDRGNSDEDELDIDAEFAWRRKHDRFSGNGEIEYDRNDNEKTKDKWQFEGSYNYFLTKHWFWGGFGRFEHDEFADLELRASIGPFLGYQWFESKALNLRAGSGIAYVDEDFINEPDDEYAALPWAVNYDQFLFDGLMQVYHRQIGFWNLEDTGDLVWDTWSGLRFPLLYGVVVSTEMQTEYDSGSAKDADDLDTTYYLKMGYQW